MGAERRFMLWLIISYLVFRSRIYQAAALIFLSIVENFHLLPFLFWNSHLSSNFKHSLCAFDCFPPVWLPATQIITLPPLSLFSVHLSVRGNVSSAWLKSFSFEILSYRIELCAHWFSPQLGGQHAQKHGFIPASQSETTKLFIYMRCKCFPTPLTNLKSQKFLQTESVFTCVAFKK